MAEHVGVSRKTYILLETARWFPPYKERAHFLRALAELDFKLVDAAVELLGGTLDDHVFKKTHDGPRLDAESAKAALDDAIREGADAMDVTARTFRPAVARALVRLAEAGVTMDQAAKLVKS